MNTYKYFLFDWDGCLADTPGVWMDTYLKLYRAEGLQVEAEDVIKKSWGNLEQGPKNFGIRNYEEFWQKIVDEVGVGLEKVILHESAKEILQKIKDKGAKIAIVTSSPAELLKPALNYHSLSRYIDVFVSADDVEHEKPDPEMLFLALEKMGADKQVTQAIIIGDTGKDILAGQNAGIDQVLTLHEANKNYYDFPKLLESKPTYVVKSFKELEDILL